MLFGVESSEIETCQLRSVECSGWLIYKYSSDKIYKYSSDKIQKNSLPFNAPHDDECRGSGF